MRGSCSHGGKILIPCCNGGEKAFRSVCATPDGPPKRGGYFFSFGPAKKAPGHFTIYDFEGRAVKDFAPDALVRFINHCTGMEFDEPSFLLCQTELNFLQDE